MENQPIHVSVVDGQPRVIPAGQVTGNETFEFQLAFRPEQFGDRQFEHWWMDIRTIYRQRGREAINFVPLANLWWKCCKENSTTVDRGVCESFLLTQLFDRTRSNGSKRVLIDSLPAKGNKKQRATIVENLEGMLRSSFNDEVGIADFSARTADFVGPPDFEQDVVDLRLEFTEQLFDEPVRLLQSKRETEAIEASVQIWDDWHRRVGRRGDKELEKWAMDILSYEARATIHRCYSHFWDFISRGFLANERGCSNASCVFHRFWHLDIIFPSNEFADRNFHLFHGHILGLHPGTHFFMQTETGRQLVGDWISVAPIGWQYRGRPETTELRRLLNGLLIAIADYSNRHDVSKYMRRESSGQLPGEINISDAVADQGSVSRMPQERRRSNGSDDE